MNTLYRFAFLTVSISTALLLNACQPTTETVEDTETVPTEEVLPPPVAVPETEVAMTDSKMTADDTQMTDMLKDYTKSIASMHDEMRIGMRYNDPDTAFAKAMLGHHRGALDIASIELKYGTDETMRKLAQKIIDAQQAEIAIMNKWLASHPDAAKPKPDTQIVQQAYADTIDTLHDETMLGIADPTPDMAFARSMLPHHMSAVDMAIIQLKYGKDEEMRKLAQQIIDEQQSEIEWLQDWIAMHSSDELIQDEAEEMAEAR